MTNNKIKMVCGLGNPGKKYENTRHNVGFQILNIFAQEINASFQEKVNFAQISFFKYGVNKILLIKPLRYMNLSGEIVQYYQNYYKIDLSDICIIHDEVDLGIGTYKFQIGASAAGHNGIKNIINHLKSKNFYRLRIGIKNQHYQKGKEFVLSNFDQNDKKTLNGILVKVLQIMNNFLQT